jgi:hypothetical protein
MEGTAAMDETPSGGNPENVQFIHPEGSVELTQSEFSALWTYLGENEGQIDNGPSDLGSAYRKLQGIVPARQTH